MDEAMWAGLIIFIIWGILAILFIIRFFAWGYPMSRDVWSKLDRAETSAEVDTMLPLVIDAVKGLKDRRQDWGHCAMWFKTENNSLEAQYKALDNVRTRLERTMKFDKNSQEYQSAIDDIRGTLRDMNYFSCWIWHFD